MNRAQRRAQKCSRRDLPVIATGEVEIPDDDPEYLMLRCLKIGIEPPGDLVNRAYAEAMAQRNQTKDVKLRMQRMMARQAAIARKIEEL